MEFNPHNPVIRLCVQGMEKEIQNQPREAADLFMEAWTQAGNDFERFTAAYYVARVAEDPREQLKWLKTSLEYALRINDHAVTSALPAIYRNMALCYESLGEAENAKKSSELSLASTINPADQGPFYHGARAELQPGDLLTPGRNSNYHPHITMNHIYFTALVNGAGLAAALANGEGPERVYLVEPTGSFENDPNVTNKKFPGNPSRSYRTALPLKVLAEIKDWVRQTPEQIRQWKEKLANSKGDIIN